MNDSPETARRSSERHMLDVVLKIAHKLTESAHSLVEIVASGIVRSAAFDDARDRYERRMLTAAHEQLWALELPDESTTGEQHATKLTARPAVEAGAQMAMTADGRG
jgi:hypothetical protein